AELGRHHPTRPFLFGLQRNRHVSSVERWCCRLVDRDRAESDERRVRSLAEFGHGVSRCERRPGHGEDTKNRRGHGEEAKYRSIRESGGHLRIGEIAPLTC